jgi:signal transduction histidine kinase
MPTGGKLMVQSKLEDGRVVAIFSDTGTGIPEAVQDRVFLPFGSKKKGGFGLSMAAAKKIVGAHGGEIGFKTKTDKGTTFRITLPVGVQQQRNT